MISLIVFLLMGVGTVIGRYLSIKFRFPMQAWCGIIGLIVLGVFGYTLSTTESLPSPMTYLFGSVAVTTTLLALTTLFVTVVVDKDPVRLLACLWSSGVLILAGYAAEESLLQNYFLMIMSIYPLLFYGRTSAGRFAFLKTHPDIFAGILTFSLGYFLQVFTPGDEVSGLFATTLLMCGLSLMLRSFPFPRLKEHSATTSPILSLIGLRFLPSLTGVVVLWNLSLSFPFARQQSFLLILISSFCLFTLGLRLWNEQYFSRRIIALALSVFHFSMFAVVLQSFQFYYPERDWLTNRPIPQPVSILILLITAETLAILLMICGQRLLLKEPDVSDHHETLSGAGVLRPFATTPLALGLASVSGCAPLIGCWWRLVIAGAWLLPLLQAYTAQPEDFDLGVLAIVVVLFMLLLFHSFANLSELRRILFAQPLRIRKSPLSTSFVVCTIVLMGVIVYWSLLPMQALRLIGWASRLANFE